MFDKFVYPINTLPWCLGAVFGVFAAFQRIFMFMSQPSIDNSLITSDKNNKFAIDIMQIDAIWPYQQRNNFF